MAKKICVFFIIPLVFLFTGCALHQTEVMPPSGILFTSVKAPLTADFEHTPNNEDLIVTSHKRTSYFRDIILTGINVAFDDADIAMIADRAGLKHVAYADYEYFNILGIYASFQVNVYGYDENMTESSN